MTLVIDFLCSKWLKKMWLNSFEPDGEFETTLQYERIDISEGIDIDKTNLSRECIICHYWYFKDLEFKFK